MIYIVVLFFFLVGIFFFRKNKKQGKLYYWFLCLLLILLWGLRFRVGGDCLRYENGWDDYPTLYELLNFDFFIAKYQPIWYIYIAIIKSICEDFVFFQLCHSIIVNVIVFYFIDKYSVNRFLTVFLYYILWSSYFNTEILREVYSILLFMCSLKYLVGKNYYKYYLLSILAFMWHTSSLILFVIPILFYSFKKISFIQYVLITIIILFSIHVGMNYLYNVIVVNFITTGALLRYENILDANSLNWKGAVFILFSMAPAIITLYYLNNFNKKENYNRNEIYKIIIMMYILMELLALILQPLSRFRNYFLILFLIILTNVAYDMKYTKRYNVYILSILVMALFRFNSYITDFSKYIGREAHYYDLYLPYHSIFDPVIELKREEIAIYQFNQ